MLRKIFGWTMTLLFAATMVIPFLWMLSTSMKSDEMLLVFPPRFFSKGMSFGSYSKLLELYPMMRMFLNSVIVAISATTGQIVVCAMAAYAFARLHFGGSKFLFLVFLATLMIPFQVIMTPLFIEIRYLNWINTYAGIIMPTMSMRIAFGVFLLRQAFSRIPNELEESAFMDGATHLTIFRSIALPLVKASLATLLVLSFMDSWNSFLWPLLVTRDTSIMMSATV